MSKTCASILQNAKSVIGWNSVNGGKQTLIDAYNQIVPLPAGYKMKYTDAWCAAGLSAIFYTSGASSIFPSECSVDRMYRIAQRCGMIVSEDVQPGDCIVYNWDSNGTLDHVGIIEKAEKNAYQVIECNLKDAVGRRVIHKSAKTIAGFFRPLYVTTKVQDNYKVDYAQYFSKAYAGPYRLGDTAAFYTGTTGRYTIMDFLVTGEIVRNYGYFNTRDGKVFLYIVREKTGKVGFIEMSKVVKL